MESISLTPLGIALATVLPASGLVAQQSFEPLVEGILSAWDRADVVCLGESHGSARDSRLRIALVRHPRFATTVDAIVVEFANPIHQRVLDRFVLDGEEMARDELGIVWRDADSPETWESPVYEEFLRAVQDVNLRLPLADRVRVIGGDSQIDWSTTETAAQLAPQMNRGKNIRETIAHQVLDRNLKALAIYGAGHCVNIGMGFPGELAPAYPNRIWSVYGFFGAEGEAAGRAAFRLGDTAAYVVVRSTPRADLPAGPMFLGAQRGLTVGDMLDAILWFGPEADRVVPASGAWPDAEARRELTRRRRLTLEAARLLYGR